jgi:hypothetical protein
MIKRVLTLDNALNITPRISINDAASSEAAGPRTEGTTGPARAPVLNDGQGLAVGKLGRRASEAQRNSQILDKCDGRLDIAISIEYNGQRFNFSS